MARVLIRFNGGNVPVVTGGTPPNEQTPIDQPTETGFVTNQAFITAEGEYCFGLETAVPYTPLWQVVQAVDLEQTTITFQKPAP